MNARHILTKAQPFLQQRPINFLDAGCSSLYGAGGESVRLVRRVMEVRRDYACTVSYTHLLANPRILTTLGPHGFVMPTAQIPFTSNVKLLDGFKYYTAFV